MVLMCMKGLRLQRGLIVAMMFITGGCSSIIATEKEYTSGKQITRITKSTDGDVHYELNRIFQKTMLEGNGMFESTNEGLARRTATNLAVAEMAAQVQTQVRSDNVIYNNRDVRDVVENRVHALVNNYRIDQAGYDPGTIKYRVRVTMSGEELVREIERQLK
jgi:hypothetical protein